MVSEPGMTFGEIHHRIKISFQEILHCSRLGLVYWSSTLRSAQQRTKDARTDAILEKVDETLTLRCRMIDKDSTISGVTASPQVAKCFLKLCIRPQVTNLHFGNLLDQRLGFIYLSWKMMGVVRGSNAETI